MRKPVWITVVVVIALIVVYTLTHFVHVFHTEFGAPETYYVCSDGEVVVKDGATLTSKPECVFGATKGYGLVVGKERLYCESNRVVMECEVSIYDKLVRKPSKTFSW